MLNIIKADLIKLKWSSWFKITLLISIILYSWFLGLIYITTISKLGLTWWVFWKVLDINSNLFLLSSFLNIFLIFIFSILVDSIFWVDKDKWLILFTKKY